MFVAHPLQTCGSTGRIECGGTLKSQQLADGAFSASALALDSCDFFSDFFLALALGSLLFGDFPSAVLLEIVEDFLAAVAVGEACCAGELVSAFIICPVHHLSSVLQHMTLVSTRSHVREAHVIIRSYSG